MEDNELFNEPTSAQEAPASTGPVASPQQAASPQAAVSQQPVASQQPAASQQQVAGEQPVATTTVPESPSVDSPAPTRRSSSSYVRKRAPRRTAEAIDDLAEDDNPIAYSHESNVATGGRLTDRSYRRARSDISQFQKNNRYGQYLEIPKGQRSIFAKRERERRMRSAIALIAVIAILAIAAYLVWQLMSSLSF